MKGKAKDRPSPIAGVLCVQSFGERRSPLENSIKGLRNQ